jgi:PAS domain S-box-containing protein
MNDQADEKLRILIVDDNWTHSALLAEYLQLEGFETVDRAGDLAGLWAQLEKNTYDILLLDNKLPDGLGVNALAEIAARGYQVPVVMVTGEGDERIAVQAIQRGAIEYLVKAGDYLPTLPALIRKGVRVYRLQLAMQRSLEQIRYQATLLNNVRDAMVVWDTQGRITYWNPAAVALFGWPAEERLGSLVEESYLNSFDPPVQVPKIGDTIGRYLERQCKTQAGRTIWVSSRVATLHDLAGGNRLIGYMDISHDITQRKQMEAQIRAAQTRLTQATRLATLGELASGVAHQINNPLTTIIAEAQILLRSLPPEEQARECAEAIEQAGWKLQDNVQRLLEFSRPPEEALEPLAVNDTILKALLLVGAYIQSVGVDLDIDLQERLPPVFGNSRQLEDLWVNLLLLARDGKQNGSDHCIKVASRLVPASFVIVDVGDNGRSIPADQLATIFEPNFFGSSCGRGTGMEFSICREIVRQHGGRITAESGDHDTIFHVMLPVQNP